MSAFPAPSTNQNSGCRQVRKACTQQGPKHETHHTCATIPERSDSSGRASLQGATVRPSVTGRCPIGADYTRESTSCQRQRPTAHVNRICAHPPAAVEPIRRSEHPQRLTGGLEPPSQAGTVQGPDTGDELIYDGPRLRTGGPFSSGQQLESLGPTSPDGPHEPENIIR